MEVEEIQIQARKRCWIGNGRDDGKVEDDDDDGECGGPEEDGERAGGDKGRLLPWQSSRIFRVSRASGGKDRHSKVLTAKGLRDRRVRLSVSTAIQFYDLQDRLGYDQPSKAVEWLIKNAAEAIAELPPLDGAFPPTPKQDSDEKRFEPELGKQHQMQQQQQQQQQLLSLSKSACSSTSETSKGSSRSENRIKARERARERTAKEKEKEKETCSSFPQQHHPNLNSQSSFTELLTGAHTNNSSSSNGDDATIAAAAAAAQQNQNPNFLHKQLRHFPPSMDYFNPGAAIFGPTTVKSGFSSQNPFSNPPLGSVPLGVTAAGSDHHPELQQFAFLQDHLVPVPAATAPNDYNLNFAISSSFAGYNRGTLQSNSSSPLLPHLQRFSSPVVTDGPPPNMPFFIGTAAAASTAAAGAENQFPAGFDARLQLYYGDGRRHSDLKGKGKS